MLPKADLSAAKTPSTSTGAKTTSTSTGTKATSTPSNTKTPSAPSAAKASSTTANPAVRKGNPGASTTAAKPLGPAALNTNGAALARPGSSSQSNGTSRKVSIDYEPVLVLSPALGFRMAQKNPVLFPKAVAQKAK